MKKNCNNCKNLEKTSTYPAIITTGEGRCSILYKLLYTTRRITIRKEYLDHFCCNFHEKREKNSTSEP